MQSSNVKEIKAALWNQAIVGATQVRCPMGLVVAVRKRKGHLHALVRGWGRWYPVSQVTIEILFALPARPRLREGSSLPTEETKKAR
jgi:hypothetical protein